MSKFHPPPFLPSLYVRYALIESLDERPERVEVWPLPGVLGPAAADERSELVARTVEVLHGGAEVRLEAAAHAIHDLLGTHVLTLKSIWE